MRADTWGPIGSVVSLACCLGFAPVITALTAVGLGFLLHDAVLIPLLVLFLGFTLWQLHRDRRRHRVTGPLIAAWLGSAVSVTALWVSPIAAWTGITLLIAGAVWNLVLVLRARIRGSTPGDR